jgi:hypothetical protein
MFVIILQAIFHIQAFLVYSPSFEVSFIKIGSGIQKFSSYCMHTYGQMESRDQNSHNNETGLVEEMESQVVRADNGV